jgi:hypothetical protein
VPIRGDFTDEAERRVVKALAKTVRGVVGVELRADTAVPFGRADEAVRP